jgi:hypothetical protein
MTGSIERIVVALDAVSENRAAIGAAARLAARWRARLHGVFVEDDDLIRLANLPFARQVTLGGGVETLDPRQAARHMRVFAERARGDLADSARRHGVEYSFEIVRDAAAAGGTSGEFLVAGMSTRPIGRHFRVECRWWAAGDAGPPARLLAHHASDPRGALAVLLRGRSEAAERLLEAAIRLAEASESRLAVICEPAIAQAPGFKSWLDAHLADHAVEVDIDLLPDRSALHRRAAELRCRLVAVEAGGDEARPERLRELIATIACDVLLVR